VSYESDKLNPNALVWKPTLKQERFLALPWEIKEGFYAGAAGAGKSDVLLLYPVVEGWVNHSDFKGLFLRRTMEELKKEIIPRSHEYFDPLGASYNQTDAVWKFPSGALLFFGHCEHEKDVHKYDTAEWNFVAFDELTSFTEWQYLYIAIQRTRRSADQIGRLPAVVRSASNPGNIGHAWVKRRFVDPAPLGGKVIVGKGGNKRIFIPATLADNSHIDPEYAKSLDALPEAERQAKKFGSWTAYEGQVFSEFREERLLSEPDNALHVIRPYDIPDWWPRIIAIDWGYAAMTWVGYGVISPSKRLILYREQSFNGPNNPKEHIESWAGKVAEHVKKEKPRDIVICRSAGQNRGEPHTIQDQVSEALGFPIRLFEGGAGSRVSTKSLLHEYLRFTPKYVPTEEQPVFDQEYANYLIRNAPVREYQKYLSHFQPPEEEKNLPKLQIFSCCPLVINAIKSCVYDKTNVEDVAEFPGDDPYDGLRYLVDSADRYFIEAGEKFKQLQATSAIIKRLEETQDWTSFYRQAKKLDQIALGPKPVARYRRYHVH
jgi:hypothetical protein